MTFGERLRTERLARNMTQNELAEKVGLRARSIYNYEKRIHYPYPEHMKKLADALEIPVERLLGGEDGDTAANWEQVLFLERVKSEYGSRGAQEAKEVLARATALFAGGELDDESKDLFFQSMMEV